MKITTLGAVALAVGVAGALPAASLAQPAPDAPRYESRGQESRAPQSRPMRERISPEQRLERRAERLRALLQLRPEQERALREYVNTIQREPGQRLARRAAERRELRQLSTPERLQAQRERLTQRLERFERRADATRRFYAQLTPAQQQAFDAMRQQRGGRGMRPGRGPGAQRG